MNELPASPYEAMLAVVRARTPARLFVGRIGVSYRTETQLELRRDHAAARDAVYAEIDMERDLGIELVQRFSLFEVCTRARSKQEYLQRPDLGRQFDDETREQIRQECRSGCVVQAVIGDGLSSAAVAAQVPGLLPRLDEATRQRGWSFGRPFFIRYCRVGILNHIGAILDPEIVVLLIGERPGLATAESLSAYLAYRPRPGHTDAQRNLISNIHARGVRHEEAVRRIMALAEQMRQQQRSGVALKEGAGLVTGSEPGLPSGNLTGGQSCPRLA